MPATDSTVRLLRDLIAIDSVNPSLVPGAAGESVIAAAIAAELRGLGLDVEITQAAPNRPNVVGILEGSRPGRSLMLCGHIDTVGVTGMQSPFDPVIAGGRIYGRGAEDMKGGVAAMIGAARRVIETGGLPAGRLIIAAVADEEYASVGAEALVTCWKADAAVVAEPTNLIIATGHKGFTWLEVMMEGTAAHGSRPQEGRDAILRMGRVLTGLEALDRKLQARIPHPVMGTSSLHASLITGGHELSTYPDRCLLQMERRSVTGETGQTALAELELILSALRAEDPELRVQSRLLFDRLPYETPSQHFIIPALELVLQKAGCTPRRGGTSFWTDAAVLGHAGIPSVIFGPGGAGLHSAEEYVEINQVLLCCNILAELARSVCV
jgi:acetylornithine deacetylase